MEKKLIPVLTIAAILTILVGGIVNSAFKDGKFTCNRYILNTYLYVSLAIIFISLILSILRYHDIFLFEKFKERLGLLFILLFIGTIATIIGMRFVSPQRVILKHLLWITFIVLMALSFHPIHYMYGKAGLDKLINSAFLTTLILVLALTAFAFYKPELISLSWGPVLFFLLLAAIVMELIIFFIKGYTPSNLHRGMSYILIGIFIGYLLYDTKLLQIRSKLCTKETADYLKESLNIFLDIWNLFIRILSVSNRN